MKDNVYVKTLFSKIFSIIITLTIGYCLILPVTTVKSSSNGWIDEKGNYHYPTKAQLEQEAKLQRELDAAGYSGEQISDQVEEEVYGIDGSCGTGGKDGLLLDGTPAPNAPGNKSSGSAASKCDHAYKSEVTKEATCTETGKTTYTCEKCGKTYTEKIPKLEHTFTVTEEVPGTCVVKGYRVEACTECGFTQTIEGIYGDHDLWINGDQLEPTCEEGGYQTEQCKICFEMFRTELPALGHEYETTPTVDYKPSCTMNGEQSYHCTRCDEIKDKETIPALGHQEVVEEKKVGIFTDGYRKVTCERCGEELGNEPYQCFFNKYRPVIIAVAILVLAVIYMVVVIKRNRKKK